MILTNEKIKVLLSVAMDRNLLLDFSIATSTSKYLKGLESRILLDESQKNYIVQEYPWLSTADELFLYYNANGSIKFLEGYPKELWDSPKRGFGSWKLEEGFGDFVILGFLKKG